MHPLLNFFFAIFEVRGGGHGIYNSVFLNLSAQNTEKTSKIEVKSKMRKVNMIPYTDNAIQKKNLHKSSSEIDAEGIYTKS